MALSRLERRRQSGCGLGSDCAVRRVVTWAGSAPHHQRSISRRRRAAVVNGDAAVTEHTGIKVRWASSSTRAVDVLQRHSGQRMIA